MKKLKLLIPIFIFCFILCLIMIIIVGWLGLDFYRSAQVNALIRPEASFPLKLKWEVDLGHFIPPHEKKDRGK